MTVFKKTMAESTQIRQALLNDSLFESHMNAIIKAVTNSLNNGGKLLLCGNGGSAADAQHIAAELSGRFKLNRAPLFAEALHVNPSFVTAVSNDYGYDEIYARMVQAMGRSGDVLVGISTSGSSKNVVRALNKARELGMVTIALLGEHDGEMGALADHKFNVPSNDTARIQEVHITLGHILCEEVEQNIFG